MGPGPPKRGLGPHATPAARPTSPPGVCRRSLFPPRFLRPGTPGGEPGPPCFIRITCGVSCGLQPGGCRHVGCSKAPQHQRNRGKAPMTTKKLLMFAVAGLLAPLAHDSVATAEVHNSVTTVALPAPTKDLAPITGTPPRLKRQDRGQAGHEQAAFAMFGDGKTGFLFAMSTELNGTRATNRIQLSLTRFTLTQDPGTGSVSAAPDTASAKFV